MKFSIIDSFFPIYNKWKILSILLFYFKFKRIGCWYLSAKKVHCKVIYIVGVFHDFQILYLKLIREVKMRSKFINKITIDC